MTTAHVRQADLPSPFGLGWTRKLALANAPPGITVRELFDRQLFIGVSTVGAAFWLVSLPLAPLFFPDLSLALMLGPLVPLLANLGLAVAFVIRSDRPAWYAHAFGLLGAPMGLFGGVPIGGISVWTNAAWIVIYPLFGAAFDGARGAILWSVIATASLLGLGAADLVYGWSAVPDPVGDYALGQAGGLGMIVLFQGVILVWFIQQRAIVERLHDSELQRNDALLANVLPAAIVPRVKAGEAVADREEEVTVVFADLVGFTTLAANVPAGRVVEMLGEIFGEIDRIAKEEGVEKVKTIGDCYMAVVGAPVRCRDHADRGLRFACRVRDAINGRTYYGSEIAVRIGVHSGPVVAGILGEQRLLWDLWGDTVNTASRLESSGVPGEVQVSEATLRLCTGKYDLDDRGVVQLKGRGGLRTFIVRRVGDAGDQRARA